MVDWPVGMDAVFAAMGDGALVLDAQGIVRQANTAALEILQRTLDEVVGQPEHACFHAKRSDGSVADPARCPIVACTRDRGVHHAYGEAFWRPDGSHVKVEYTAMAIEGEATLVLFRVVAPAGGAAAGDARPHIRRLLHHVTDAAALEHGALTRAGRSYAAEAKSKTLESFASAYAEAGFGDLELESDERGRATFIGHDLLERRDGARTTTCFFTLGYLNEAVRRANGDTPTLGTELACQSRGAKECRFVIQLRESEEGLARRVKELI